MRKIESALSNETTWEHCNYRNFHVIGSLITKIHSGFTHAFVKSCYKKLYGTWQCLRILYYRMRNHGNVILMCNRKQLILKCLIHKVFFVCRVIIASSENIRRLKEIKTFNLVLAASEMERRKSNRSIRVS